MNDVDRWIYFDGPEPERVRPLLDELRDLTPPTPQDKERVARKFFEKLDADLARRKEELGGDALDEDTNASPPPEQDAPASPVAPAPEGLTGTAPMLEIPAAFREQMGKLPFKPAPPEQPGAVRTLQIPVMRSTLGETAPLGDDTLAKVVAALPFAGNTVGTGIVPFPRLKLEEYASLRAELSVWPERSAEIMLRYHVLSAAGRGALDEHWKKHFAEQPEARRAFEKVLGEFTAWLRTERG